MTCWRISPHADLSGVGGMYASGRWHTRGTPVVYLADHPASCLLEMLVQGARLEGLPPAYQWLRVEITDVTVTDALDLPYRWRDDIAATRALGDTWLQGRPSALLRVPSVIVPDAWNFLLNPVHPDAARCRISAVVDHDLDPRLR